ncbi:MAG TPA: DnaA/Hda family protein, partial [Pirellulales bacterium]
GAPKSAGGSDFIVGPESRLAATTVLEFLNRGTDAISPLVLCGASGTGKSHLAEHVARLKAGAVFTRGADFARELAEAVNHGSVAEFRTKYREAAALVLDDLLQLTGRRPALLEFQNMLDALEVRGTPVLITSRRPPADVAELPPALRSRLSAALVVTLSSPGMAARQKILNQFAAQREIVLSPAAVNLLAEKIAGTAADLRGVVTELEMETGAQDAKAVGLDAVRRLLSQRRTHMQAGATLKQVSALVAKYYGLTPSALSSPSRRQQVVLARAMAIYLGRSLCGASLKTLGKHFGGRDHSTVLHNYRQILNRLAGDPQLSGAVESLQHALIGNG